MQERAVSDAQAAAGPQTRASDVDRERTVELLNAAFAEGRLTQGELDERVRSAYAARSWQQLRQLTQDLPTTGPLVASPEPPAAGLVPGVPAELDHLMICLTLCLCPPVGIYLLATAWRRARQRERQVPSLGRALGSAEEPPYPARDGRYLS